MSEHKSGTTKYLAAAAAALVVVVILVFTVFDSEDESSSNYEERNMVMKSLGGAMKKLGAAVATGDTAEMQNLANQISSSAVRMPALFEGQGPSDQSRAKAEIWLNFDDFTAKANALKIAADSVAADAADGKLGSDPTTIVGKIGATCGACHKAYLGPKV